MTIRERSGSDFNDKPLFFQKNECSVASEYKEKD